MDAPKAPPASAAEALERVAVVEGADRAGFGALADAPAAIASEPLDAAAARALWQRLRAAGLGPVIVDAQVPLELHAEAAASRLAAAAALTPERFIDERRREHKRVWLQILADAVIEKTGKPSALLPEDTSYAELSRRCRQVGVDCPERDAFADELARLMSLPPDVAERQPPPGDFQFAVRDRQLAELGVDVDPLRARVVLVAAPLWDLCAHIDYGGWNECPPAPVHAALHRSWHERFGAELAFVGPDTLELAVARPPATAAALRELAWEQFVYCPDIVYQGTGTLDALARELAGSPRWFFWWD